MPERISWIEARTISALSFGAGSILIPNAANLRVHSARSLSILLGVRFTQLEFEQIEQRSPSKDKHARMKACSGLKSKPKCACCGTKPAQNPFDRRVLWPIAPLFPGYKGYVVQIPSCHSRTEFTVAPAVQNMLVTELVDQFARRERLFARQRQFEKPAILFGGERRVRLYELRVRL